MSSCEHNFSTLSAEDTDARNLNQCWNQNLDPYIAVYQIEQERAENKNTRRQERCTSAFAELFEDLQRYIQEEQNSTSAAQCIQDGTPVCHNQLYQCNTFTPVQNIVQFPPHVPVQSSYPQIVSHHSGIVHQAHISFIPINSGLKTIIKRKRKRTTFTTEQVNELEKYFSKTPYVTRQDREVLVKRLNINDKAVKIWFQNRRLKGKRDQCQSPSSDTTMTETGIIEFHLDNIESHINEKTDRFGYVTLDDSVMDSLMNITDYYLQNKNYSQPIEDPSTECESIPIYEPISPPDSTKEEDLPCQLEEFKESLEACYF